MLQCSIPSKCRSSRGCSIKCKGYGYSTPTKKAKKLKRRNDAMSQFSVCRLGTFIRKEEML